MEPLSLIRLADSLHMIKPPLSAPVCNQYWDAMNGISCATTISVTLGLTVTSHWLLLESHTGKTMTHTKTHPQSIQ